MACPTPRHGDRSLPFEPRSQVHVLRGLTHRDNITKLRQIISLPFIPFVGILHFIFCARVCPLLQFQHVTTNSKTRR
jgi:hypothetical protein